MDSILKNIKNKEDPLVIFEIGSKDCANSIELYNTFPNAILYALDCCNLDVCKQTTKEYNDRITIIEDNICQYEGTIDICFINEHTYESIRSKISLNKVKLLVNNSGVLFDNSKTNMEMFCVYHKQYFVRNDNFYFTFFGVNEVYPKEQTKNNILEYTLERYNPFLQKRGFMETSAYLHIYWNKLYKGKDMVGVSQYDMKHNETYHTLDKNTMYVLSTGQPIVQNNTWHTLMFPKLIDVDFLITSYNKHFNKTYSITELNNKPLSLWQTNIYPVLIYEKLCSWLEKLVEEIYPWSNLPPYQTHFGSIGGYTERALSIFNAFEMFEGIPCKSLNIVHGIGTGVQEQYNHKSFLNNYSQDIHTTYIDTITGKHTADFCMFKSECYLNDIRYNCERVYKHNKNGLIFTKSDWDTPIERGFDIEAQDPRIFMLNDIVYVIFICLSPYNRQKYGIGFTQFDEWNPIVLQVEHMEKNPIEKNWAPFVKEGELYFVYNYDPLVILKYDLNKEGICNIVYKQQDIQLPINTSNTHLRGGSNLLHYKDEYFIGGCHSRIHKRCYQHYTHIVLLDTKNWKLVYVSKPVLYYTTIKEKLNAWHQEFKPMSKELDTVHTILNDATPHIIQDPISLYLKKNAYYMTINVRDCVSLLYKIEFGKLVDFKEEDEKGVGYWDLKIRQYADTIN